MKPAATHPVQLALGFVIWSAWFVAAYGGLSVACGLAPPPEAQGARTWINAALGLLTLATAAVLLTLAWRCWRARRSTAPGQAEHFVAPLAAALHAAAAGATLFVGLPATAIPPCV
jgi:hypothetical protein